jgi:prepilin-type N-terminal cleavage/methylation domain-containing protein
VTGPARPRRRLPRIAHPGGFTLIELTVVILIIVIISSIAIPRLRDVAAVELTASTRRLANATRYLYEEAALRGSIYALAFDLDEQDYYVARLDRASGEFVEDDSLLSRRVTMPDGVRIADVVLPGVGKLTQGTVPAYFYPEGYADRAVIHLVDHRNNAYTLAIDPVRGRSDIADGYIEVETPRTE